MSESSLDKTYHPQGNSLVLLKDKHEEVLHDGPVGTGKSRAALEKLFLLASKYPGMRGLILRKTRKSCTDTCLVTWEEEVVPQGHPCLKGGRRDNRHSYLFPNRSEVVVGGMDDPTKIMSSQWDFVYANESIELQEEDAEALTTRMRNGKMPFDQIVFDTNPGPPSHWLWKKYLDGKIHRIQSTIKDNRRYWDEAKQEFTLEGNKYLAKLDRTLTGSRRTRLLQGLWGIAEGARFPMLDSNVHQFDAHVKWPFGMPGNMVRFISIDHGLSSPYCALWHAVDTEGDVWTYREDYGPGFTADIQAERVIQYSGEDERFYGEMLDPSMWNQDKRGRGIAPGEKEAAMYYEESFAKDALKRFGPLIKGIKDPSKGYPTLDALLNRGNGFANWHIERGCTNLWDEMIGAIFWRTPQGIWTEKLDPKCPDHAITSASYGLSSHYTAPTESKDDLPTIEDFTNARLERRKKLSERNFERTFPAGRKSRY